MNNFGIYQIGKNSCICTNSSRLNDVLKHLLNIIDNMENDICTITGLSREEVVKNYEYLNSTNMFDVIADTQDEKLNIVLLAHEINKYKQ